MKKVWVKTLLKGMGGNFVKSMGEKRCRQNGMGENFVKSMVENFVKVSMKKDRRKKYG